MLEKFNEKNRDLLVNINGVQKHRGEGGISPFDSLARGGDSVWEGLRLCEGRIFRLTEHLDRLRRSAEALHFGEIPSQASRMKVPRHLITCQWIWDTMFVVDLLSTLPGNGLITLGAYTGKLQHAKWETFDYECNMDGMKMTVHPTRKGPDEGRWYADICVPGNNAYLILGERSLARLAEVAGDKAMAARRRLREDRL